jgi:hypothetical protein
MRIFLILFATLAVSLLTTNAQQQVPENGGPTAKGRQSQGGKRDKPSDPSAVGHFAAEPPSQPKTQIHESAPTPDVYSVKIVSQPSDGWYIAYVAITAFVALIGFGTLCVIWRQTNHAGRQVDALMSAERARMWFSVEWQCGNSRLEYSSERNTTLAVLRLTCENVGKTPAQILNGKIGMAIYKTLPERLDFNLATGALSAKGLVSAGKPVVWDISLECEGFADIGIERTVIFGIVPYLDVFGEKQKATFGFDSTLSMITDRPYNQNT